MLLDTLWVNTKLKVTVPSAGREMPSIFCSTHGPTLVLVVVAAPCCHGQASLICGRCTSTPANRNTADSAISAIAAIARRNTSATSPAVAAQPAQRGTRLRGARGRVPAGPPGTWVACTGTSRWPAADASRLSSLRNTPITFLSALPASGQRSPYGYRSRADRVAEQQHHRDGTEPPAKSRARLVGRARMIDARPAHAQVRLAQSGDRVRELHRRGAVVLQQGAPAECGERLG